MSRRPGPLARRWLLIAAVAATLSLGLPWSTSPTFGVSVIPGFCSTSYCADGFATTECGPATTQFAPTGGLTPSVGYQHPVRVLGLVTAGLVVAGYRRGHRGWLLAAPAPGVLALCGYGLTGTSGQLVFAAALGALVMALVRDGVVPRRPAARPA